MAWAAGILAAAGTGAWAIQLAHNSAPDDLRYAFVGAGVLALLSFLVLPPCQPPREASVGMAFTLAGYQALVFLAVSRGGSLMQAVINCNVIVVALHRHFFVKRAERPLAFAVAVVSAASTAGLLTTYGF